MMTGPHSASKLVKLLQRFERLEKNSGLQEGLNKQYNKMNSGLQDGCYDLIAYDLIASGIKKCSIITEASNEEAISQITDMSSSLHSVPVQITTSNHSLETKSDTILSLGPVQSVQPRENLSLKQTKENNSSSVLNLDLNYNPFHPYKNLEQVGSTVASECGSTTGHLEESEPLRKWNAMKKNGFLSSSHGNILLSKPRDHQPKRRKEELKKKTDMTKREQVNKYAKITAPSGLLSGLNPGIIKHVRNSKQVNSIIEAIIQSEKTESQIHYRPSFLSSSKYRETMSDSYIGGSLYQKNYSIAKFSSEYDDDTLALKLSPAVTMASENVSNVSNDALSTSQDAVASLSLKGASVASQWLDLLQQDIKGRLAALRRSKKRVRNVIQTELPYLLSKEISDNQENEDHFSHSCERGCLKKEVLDMHMARWKSIFSQMDKSLYEEGKHLENWLKQVQDMQLHCEGGLKFFNTNPNELLAAEFSGQKKSELVERGYAVTAAAASIYSTCNFITTKENVPCF